MGKIGITITIIGFIAQIGYFITRWIAAGHAPVSNLFEFTTFFGMMSSWCFYRIYFIYKTPLLGLFTLPVAIINYCICKYVSKRYIATYSSIAK